MEILNKRVICGPNYWYIDRKNLVVVTLRLESGELEMGEKDVLAVAARFSTLKPALYQRGSYQGILDLVAQIAVEIQCRSGMDCMHAHVAKSHTPSIFKLIFSYTLDRAGLYAAEAAVALANALIAGENYDLENDVNHLKQLADHYHLPDAIQQMVDLAMVKNIPVCRLDFNTLIFGQGTKQCTIKKDDTEFPASAIAARIPIVTISGDRNKAEIGRFITQMASSHGFSVGYSASTGVYVKGDLIAAGDRSGRASAALVLQHPEVDFAVLECNEKEILRSGLAFDQCNISIVSSLNGITAEMLPGESFVNRFQLSLVVLKCIHPEGYAVLNADDEDVYALAKVLKSKIALYSTDRQNLHIRKHVDAGGTAAVIDDGQFMVFEKGERILSVNIGLFTIGMDGKTDQMVQCLLPALLAAYLFELPVYDVKQLSTLLMPQ